MACNSCSKPYTLFRKEKGCPGCGFGFCSKCLDNKVFLGKLNSEAKVCSKCKLSGGKDVKRIAEPPDAFYKRFGAMSDKNESNSNNITTENNTDEEIRKRLQRLKEDKNDTKGTTDEEISKRLQNIKGPQSTTTDAELHLRLANLKGIPALEPQIKPLVFAPDARTEQEQANDLMKQYLAQANIDTQYQDGFKKGIDEIEARMQKLKGDPAPSDSKSSPTSADDVESDDDESMVKKIIEKAKAESVLQYDDDGIPATTDDELPFCEICNEDAKMRCLGCRYLFCKRCFMEHKDDDDGCNRYEPYQPPKNIK